MRASVVISTFNRSDALAQTLAGLSHQDIPADAYEVIVVDDGSTDDTATMLAAADVPFPLVVRRTDHNRGVSAGRNLGMSAARGDVLILLSDDVIVPESFVRLHVETVRDHPGYWVVGAFSQLPELTRTPFGRYLDRLESSFEQARIDSPLGDGLYEMGMLTARNLSLPRADIERIGMFDEQFRTTCEDQDLAIRASAVGVRFLYNTRLRCVHNDAAADLRRYCAFQERGARDTVRMWRKYPEIVAPAEIVAVNGPARLEDGPTLLAKKLLKRALAGARTTALLASGIAAGERAGLPDAILFRAYTTLIGIHIFRGWRAELRAAGA